MERAGRVLAGSEGLDKEKLLGLYRTMVTIREFEDEVYRRFLEGEIYGTTHLYQGQEAVSAGVMAALEPKDYVTVTHRGHGHCVSRGLSLEAMFAEMMGRETGVCRGRGGSMHLKEFHRGVIGSFAIVGAGLPPAVGAALSAKYKGEDRVAVAFFGEGATNIGAFHESLNLAAVMKAPVLFVCENNLYGEFTRINRSTPVEDIALRADSYAMPGRIVDGNDVLAVYSAAREAVERARKGEGPTLLECKTYRHRGHSRTDPAKYRPADEVEHWMSRDPIKLFEAYLRENGIADIGELTQMRESINLQVVQAANAASQAPWPDPSEIERDVYA